MNLSIRICFLLFATTCFSAVASPRSYADESDFLDNATVITADLMANDIVFDQVRDVLYASIPSAAGLPYGNSIVTLDPDTLDVLDSIFIGSEPSKLAISNDGSRVYVGIDGALAIRFFEPGTGVIGPLQTLSDNSIAEDIQVAPKDPKTVVVSSDQAWTSGAGLLEVFDDTGQISSLRSRWGANSITFIDSETLFGFENDSSGFDTRRYDFNGRRIKRDAFRGALITGFRETIEASNGLVFATNGQVVNPESMTLVGSFPDASGAVEPSHRDGIAYFMEENRLMVFDLNSFAEIDTATLAIGNSDIRTLEFAGTDQLAFVDSEGSVGVISGVSISEKPLGKMVIRGTDEDDVCVFDATTREMTVNGIVTKVPYEVTTLFFNGRGGRDSLQYVSDENADEHAVLQPGAMIVDLGSVLFSAFNTEDLRFEADESSNDVSAVFDSVEDETVFVRPHRLSMDTADGSIETNNRGRTVVYSSGGGDRAILRSGNDSDSVRVKFGQQLVEMTSFEKSVVLSGFGDVYINAGAGDDDRAIVFDSPSKEFFYSIGDFNVLFDNEGKSYRFKGFDFLSVASSGGGDIAYLQKTETSQTRGNANWSSIYDTFFNNNVYNFFRVDIRD